MESTKCFQCGLVSWNGAVQCPRCGAVIESIRNPVTTGRNPFEGQESRKGFRAVHALILLLVVSAIGYGTYKVTSPAPPKEKPLAEQAAGLQQMQAQGQGAVQEQVVREQPVIEDWEKDRKGMEEVKFQKFRDPKCKMTGTISNPSTGGYSPVMECK